MNGLLILGFRGGCSEKAEVKRVQAQERANAGDRPRERGPAVLAPDDEDLEWQLMVAANRDAGYAREPLLHAPSKRVSA